MSLFRKQVSGIEWNPKVDLDLDLDRSYNKLREKFPATGFGGRPTLSEAGFDLLNKMLTYDPNKVLAVGPADVTLEGSRFANGGFNPRKPPTPKTN